MKLKPLVTLDKLHTPYVWTSCDVDRDDKKRIINGGASSSSGVQIGIYPVKSHNWGQIGCSRNFYVIGSLM